MCVYTCETITAIKTLDTSVTPKYFLNDVIYYPCRILSNFRDLNDSGFPDFVLIFLRTAEKPLGLTDSARRLTIPKGSLLLTDTSPFNNLSY